MTGLEGGECGSSSLDRLVDDVKEVRDLGIPAVLFFGLPEKKDEMASEAYSHD